MRAVRAPPNFHAKRAKSIIPPLSVLLVRLARPAVGRRNSTQRSIVTCLQVIAVAGGANVYSHLLFILL